MSLGSNVESEWSLGQRDGKERGEGAPLLHLEGSLRIGSSIAVLKSYCAKKDIRNDVLHQVDLVVNAIPGVEELRKEIRELPIGTENCAKTPRM